MSDVEKSSAQKNAMRELSTALIATAITLVAAIIIYIWVPDMQYEMRDHAAKPGYSRTFKMEAGAGHVVYQVEDEKKENAEQLLKDLELLQRRFERGNFQMATISILAQKEQVDAMQAQSANFRYNIARNAKGAELIITPATPAARSALDAYLQFIQASWKI